MTSLQLAKAECANYQNNGSCLGAEIADNLKLISYTEKARCFLADEKRCKYFEECVLPMVSYIKDEQKFSDYQEAEDIYEERKKKNGISKGNMERAGDDGTIGMQQTTASLLNLELWSARAKTSQRTVCLSGRRRAKVDRWS